LNDSTQDLTQVEYRALAEFRFRIQRFLHFSEEEARASGLEPRQHQLLLAVKGLPEGQKATIGEISSRLQLRPNSAVELVNRMAAHGLVRRTSSPHDRRQVVVALTASGTAVLRRLALIHRRELESAGPELLKALRAVVATKNSRRVA